MSNFGEENSFDSAALRLEQALARLKAGARGLDDRLSALERLKSDNDRLGKERGQLSAELERNQARLRRLDESASDVSRRLVDVVETVKSVLAN